ncbi:MAG: succinate dehydrogenase assembly factor 2 [Mariprofundaceae bacterium]
MPVGKGREMTWRRLRYRLHRQGMLELDAWLAPRAEAMASDATLAADIESLLALEPPELQAMMEGRRPVPSRLRPWLGRS